MTTTPAPWVATDEDCETGYLIGAPEGLTPEQALEGFLRLFKAEFGTVESVDGEPLFAELRPFREPDGGENDDAALVACLRGEEPTEMVWVVEGINWVDTATEPHSDPFGKERQP